MLTILSHVAGVLLPLSDSLSLADFRTYSVVDISFWLAKHSLSSEASSAAQRTR